MKRLSFLLLLLFTAAVFTGCGAAPESPAPGEAGEPAVSDGPVINIEITGPPIKSEPIETPPEAPDLDLTALDAAPADGAVDWSLEDGVLTISGSGGLTDALWREAYHDGNARSVTTVVFGHGITQLPYSPFGDCDPLTTVFLGDGLTEVPSETFCWCTHLEQVHFGKNITSIGGGAFERCAFRELVIPDTVTFINIGAFAHCENLEKILIPASVTEIGQDAFEGCERLTIFAPGGSAAEDYARENGIPFSAALE